MISPQVAASLRQMLEGVLAPGGTASEVSIPGYQLAGKTGTANKPDPVTGGYSDTKFVASFVGFAPARDPRLLVAVMVDEPAGRGIRWSGRRARLPADRRASRCPTCAFRPDRHAWGTPPVRNTSPRP